MNIKGHRHGSLTPKFEVFSLLLLLFKTSPPTQYLEYHALACISRVKILLHQIPDNNFFYFYPIYIHYYAHTCATPLTLPCICQMRSFSTSLVLNTTKYTTTPCTIYHTYFIFSLLFFFHLLYM